MKQQRKGGFGVSLFRGCAELLEKDRRRKTYFFKYLKLWYSSAWLFHSFTSISKHTSSTTRQSFLLESTG